MSVELIAGDGGTVVLPLFAPPQGIRTLRLALGSATVEISASQDEAGLTALNVALTTPNCSGCSHRSPTGTAAPPPPAPVAFGQGDHGGPPSAWAPPAAQATSVPVVHPSLPHDSEIELHVLPAHAASPGSVEGVLQNPTSPLLPTDQDSSGSDDARRTGEGWLKEMREMAMLVALLVASVAYPAGLNPPGGMWQEDSQAAGGGQMGSNGNGSHRAGDPVMRDVNPKLYAVFKFANSAAFALSLAMIVLLTRESTFRHRHAAYALRLLLSGAVIALGMAYVFAYSLDHDAEDKAASFFFRYVTMTFLGTVGIWSCGPSPRRGRLLTWFLYALRLVTTYMLPVMSHIPFLYQSNAGDTLLLLTIMWSS